MPGAVTLRAIPSTSRRTTIQDKGAALRESVQPFIERARSGDRGVEHPDSWSIAVLWLLLACRAVFCASTFGEVGDTARRNNLKLS